MGNKTMDSNRVLPNPATPMYGGAMGGMGSVPLGNQVATNVGGGGPGKGRTLYGKSGTNQQYGGVAGEPWTPGRGFDDRGRR
jgi:hypothetical protein